jgi:hypothetical protein
MDQQPQDPPAARARARGLRQVRRWSNGTAAALIAATVLTTGYFARASHSAAVAASTAGAAGMAAGMAAGQPGTAASTHQPCVSVPVATSGGSGVTSQTVIRSCGTGTGTSVPVVISTGRTHEGGDS